MVLRKEMSKMIKKIILVILVLVTIYFIGDTNLKGNSVYYAKHSPSSNVRDLELMMFTENLDHLGKKDGFKYKHKIHSSYTKTYLPYQISKKMSRTLQNPKNRRA